MNEYDDILYLMMSYDLLRTQPSSHPIRLHASKIIIITWRHANQVDYDSSFPLDSWSPSPLLGRPYRPIKDVQHHLMGRPYNGTRPKILSPKSGLIEQSPL